jgi:hypothetical protein
MVIDNATAGAAVQQDTVIVSGSTAASTVAINYLGLLVSPESWRPGSCSGEAVKSHRCARTRNRTSQLPTTASESVNPGSHIRNQPMHVQLLRVVYAEWVIVALLTATAIVYSFRNKRANYRFLPLLGVALVAAIHGTCFINDGSGDPEGLATFGIVFGLFLGAPAGLVLMKVLRNRQVAFSCVFTSPCPRLGESQN